jgi:NDP-sugar pyrophosphorylase family protein
MDVMILMAGRGSRFKDLYPETPKPLVPLHGKPLVRWVVENLRLNTSQRFIFVCLKEHVTNFNLRELFSSWKINFEIVEVSEVTEGAACSAMLAKPLLNNDELLIANSDQFVEYDKKLFLEKCRNYDGAIMSMGANGNKWSYIQTDLNDLVTVVKEKEQISNTGTVGIYYFKQANYFIKAVEKMISSNDRFNNEFYLAPCYNYLIKNKQKVGHFYIGSVGDHFTGLGTSEDFSNFETSSKSAKIAEELFSCK